MRPLYFCANCKQYHATCKQKNIHQSSSVQYLRFSDLFCIVPNAHPQNFTVNSPRAPQNSRLVYAHETTRKYNSANKKILIKVNSTKKYDTRSPNYPHSYSKQSRNTTGDKTNKYSYTDSTAKKKQSKNANNITRLRTYENTVNDLSEFKDRIRTHQKQKVSNFSEMNETKIQQDDRMAKKGPYYVISKIDAENSSKNSKYQLKISGAESSLAQKIKSKQVNGSYVYGDHDRKILMSDTKVKQFRYGDLADSVQDLALRQAGGSSYYTKIGLPPKSQPPKYKQSQQKQLRRSDAKNRLYESQQIQGESSQMNIKQPRVGHIDYANKIKQLRTVLKSNQKNYKQRQSKIDQRQQSQGKFDLYEYEQSSPAKSKIQQNNRQYVEQKFTNASKISKQQLKKKVKLKIANRLYQHQPNPKANQLCHSEPQHCKYFDNRCFGLSLCGSDQINYISGESDLV